jgi:hypothetical protein
MTIYRTLLTRAHFPKELPPAFFTGRFARYATTVRGRTTIAAYQPADRFTECVRYRLALPGAEHRELRILHPVAFAKLANLTARNLGRLLKKASASKFARSRPIFVSDQQRAIRPMINPANQAKEKAMRRSGARYLVKADVSQFYPSLYTHAVGWAVDPRLRQKRYWKNQKFLGKRLDQELMNADGKMSQGIPIGNDISFLLAEIVLAQVDRAVGVPSERAYRWFDDYEIAVDSRDEAEDVLRRLRTELDRYRLRLNPMKTTISDLPKPIEQEWRRTLSRSGALKLETPRDMVSYFDTAFGLRDEYPDTAVLLYALGILFRLRRPNGDTAEVAQSCISQAILCEPGAAQKAFALLSFWSLNGIALNVDLLQKTIEQMVLRHRARGPSSDVAWALAFCLEQNLSLNSTAARALATYDDDCILLEALHMNAKGLFPSGFTTKQISKKLKNADLDREHWLLAYETVKQGFLMDCDSLVRANSLFSELFANQVTFYRTMLPKYASVIHPGGAPEWSVRNWLQVLAVPEGAGEQAPETFETLVKITEDLDRLGQPNASLVDKITDLMDILSEDEFETLVEDEDTYWPESPIEEL